MKHVFLVGFFASLLAACATAPETIEAVLQNRTDTILKGIKTGDMTPVLDLFTEDAIYSPDGGTLLTDREGLAAYWNAVANSPAADGVLEAVDIQRLAPDAFVEIQRYEVFDADGNRLFGGHASLLWRKVDGRWLIASDVSND